MVMAYFYYRALGNTQLVAIGLLSFAAITQLGAQLTCEGMVTELIEQGGEQRAKLALTTKDQHGEIHSYVYDNGHELEHWTDVVGLDYRQPAVWDGMIAALKAGFIQEMLSEEANRKFREIDSKERLVVGVNHLVIPEEEELEIPIQEVHSDCSEAIATRMANWKKTRDMPLLTKRIEQL